MATRRKVAEEKQEEEDTTSNGTSGQEKLKRHRKDLKTQVDRERQRRRDTIRWVVVGLFLLLALLGLYYYMTRYSVARPPAAARPKAKPTPADKAKAKAQTPKKKRDDKTAPGATKPSEPSAGKKEKDAKSGKPKPKEAGKTSKKPASGKSLPDAKKQPSPKKASGSAAKKPKPAPPPQRKESIVDEVDLSKIRLLRRPFPPADADRPHLMEILSADNLLEAKRFNHAIEKFNEVLKRFPQSPRSLLGKGQALEGLAREKRSNKLMDKAMEFYEDASKVVTANADIKSAALVFLAGAAEVRGKPTKEIAALEKLYALREEMPRDAGLLGLAHLRAGEPKKAKPYFEKVLEASPDDSFARGHLGFVLFSEGQYEEALPLLLDGIRNDPTLKANPKFYLYTGEALNRLRRADEAFALYAEAVSLDLFPSVWQRSVYNEDGLRAAPWWLLEDTGYADEAERISSAVDAITEEAQALLSKERGVFTTSGGHHLVLFSNGKKNAKNCEKAPRTCRLIEAFPEAARCKVGEVKLSVLPPQSHFPPRAGPTNTRLELILPLSLTTATEDHALRVRAAEETRTLQRGTMAVFDDSFEHEMWYDGRKAGLLLIIHAWHPDLSPARQKQLRPLV